MRRIMLLLIGVILWQYSGFAQANDPTSKLEDLRIEVVNMLCRLEFTNMGLVSMQDASRDYLVYEVPGLAASELKASTLNTISSMCSSPKDVVTSLSDNMIQFDGYVSRAYYSEAGDALYPVDFTFAWTMQFKDGKIRINIPKIKQIYITEVPLMGTLKLDMSKPITVLISEDSDRGMVANELNKFIHAICENAQSSNDW